MKIHDVRTEYIESLQSLTFPDLTAERIVELRIQGVTIEQAQKARQVYGDSLSASDLVEMAIQGTLRKLR